MTVFLVTRMTVFDFVISQKDNLGDLKPGHLLGAHDHFLVREMTVLCLLTKPAHGHFCDLQMTNLTTFIPQDKKKEVKTKKHHLKTSK